MSARASVTPLRVPPQLDHLRDVLILTNAKRLMRKFGARATAELLEELGQSSRVASITDFRTRPDELEEALASAPGVKGVLILGGYDVLSPAMVDVRLDDDPSIRYMPEEVPDFIAWSDDCYGGWDFVSKGTRTAVRVARLPVSRLPDRADLAFVRHVLSPRSLRAQTPFGLRNMHRIFADAVFNLISPLPMFESLPVRSRGPAACRLTGDRLYIVLHGEQTETMKWYGEDGTASQVCAVTPRSIGNVAGAVVFTAACFGACLSKPAHLMGEKEKPKPAERLALHLLQAGASAVVGVTGIHDSPQLADPQFDYLAGPLHKFFWKHILAGQPPAGALHRAKLEYAKKLHFSPDAYPDDQARERKVVYQFSCLGTGW